MKRVVIAISLFISLMAVSIVAFVRIRNQEVSITNKVNAQKLNIALVNEDSGGSLRGQSYNFGDDFTALLSKDTTSNWTVLSRNAAENRFDNGSIDVIVYIEQQFSDKIVQLESFNPSKAKITYKTKSDIDPVKASNVELRVGDYLNMINQNVIKMYFSSVVNNLDDAKRNVENIVDEQSGTHTKISQYIYTPSADASQYIVGVNNYASSLQQSNASFEDAQKAMTDSVSNLLDTTGQSLNRQLGEVRTYFELQDEISRRNLITANDTLKQRHLENYGKFDKLYTKLDANLKSFAPIYNDLVANEEEKLKHTMFNYNEKIKNYKGIVAQQKGELEKVKANLEEQRKTISRNFFSVEAENPQREDKDELTKQARLSLASLVSNSLSDDKETRLPASYTNMINSAASSISYNSADYQELFAKLTAIGALSSTQVAEYNTNINLIASYAQAKGLAGSGMKTFEFLTVADDAEGAASGNIPVTVQLPLAEKKDDFSDTDKASPQKVKVWVERTGGSAENASVSLAAGEQEVTTGQAQQVIVNYSFATKVGENSIEFTLHIGNTSIPMTKTFYVSDKNDEYTLVKKDLSTIFDYLARINRAAGMIQAIYAGPNDTTVDVSNPPENSVYKMYGNIGKEDIAERLNDQQVENFKNQGVKLLTDIDSSISSLSTAISEMNKITDDRDLLPEDYFRDNLESLAAWYNKAGEELKAAHDSWREEAVQINASVEALSPNEATEQINDRGNSRQFYSSIESLVDTTATGARETTRNQEAVGSMKTQFDELLSQVRSVKENIDKTSETTNDLISTEAETIQENRAYSDNFKSILKNFRNGGITNQNVMDFISKPIEVKKEAKSTPISADNTLSWVIVGIVGSSLLSIVVTYWLTKSSIQNKA